MGRLDKAIQHCKGQVPDRGKRIKRTGLGRVDLKFWEVARPSWDERPYTTKPEHYAVTNNIKNYSAAELMVALRGAAVVVREIADDINVEGDNETDLKYISGRIDLLVVSLEEKIRTVNGKYDETS